MNENKENTATSPPVITYRVEGDYLIPNISIPEHETKLPTLTKWGMMRLDYLKNHRRILYTDLKLSGELFLHCHEVEEQAKNRMQFMMKQMVEKFPVSESLKDTDPLAWAGHMNGLKHRVEEVIKADLIYE